MPRFFGFVFAACLLAVAAPSSVPAASPDWPKSLTLATASPGGVYYVYGDELAKILSEKLDIAVNPLPTQGPAHNVKLIETHGAQLGMITMGVGLQGWNGTGDWTHGEKFRNMRALFPMYDTPFQFVALQRSAISSVAEFNGKNVGVGPRAGTGGAYVPIFFKTLGISAQIYYGAWNDVVTTLGDGKYDAIVAVLGAPMPALKKMNEKEPLKFISLSAEETESLRKAFPELSPSTIPAGTYPSQDKDYQTVGLFNFAIGRADLPNDLVYQLVKTVFENQASLAKVHPSALETVPKNTDKNTFLPFHPGAVRYYREIGISIPDSLAGTN